MKTTIIAILAATVLLLWLTRPKNNDSYIEQLHAHNDSLKTIIEQSYKTFDMYQDSIEIHLQTINLLNNEVARLHNRRIDSYFVMSSDSALRIFADRAENYLNR